jgi:hypothetical protein
MFMWKQFQTSSGQQGLRRDYHRHFGDFLRLTILVLAARLTRFVEPSASITQWFAEHAVLLTTIIDHVAELRSKTQRALTVL